MKYIKGIFIIFAIFALGYLVLGEVFMPADGPERGYACEELNDAWEAVSSDGAREAVVIPGTYQGEIVLERTLPDSFSENVSCICFRGMDMDVYIDGILRQSYSTEETRIFGNDSAEAYVMVSLLPEDAGKVITVHMKKETGILYSVYLGNRMGIWMHLFKDYGLELVIAILTLVLGLLSIIGSIALRILYHRSAELEYLGWGVSFAAIWLITNSVFRQIMFPSISVISDIPFIMIAITPFPFIIYMNEVQRQRYRKVYLCAGCLDVMDFVVCLVLHMSNIKDFHETFLVIAACCLISILVICITILIDIRKKLIHEYWLVAIGILSAVFTASIQIILYFRRTGIFSGSTFAVGLILLLTFSVINTIHGIIVIERDKRDAVMASEAKGRFLANMSHEIRTPINAVLGMNAMILRESTEEPIREYAMDIRTAGQNLLSLINDILDFSKIESGKMELALVEYDFSSMIHDIMNMITVKAQSKDLYVELHIDAGLPSKLYGDDTRIRQILVNILNNAVKYTNEGGVTLTITGEPHEDRIRLHVSVADTGIGIKEEDISKLFAEFERIEESRNRNIEGTGLGMNITTQLLGLMDSKLEVHSVYGEGSVFSFDLEQRIVDAEPIGNLEERIQQQTQQFQYEVVFTAPDARVLVVDDNAVNRKVFVKLLKETRISIDAAASGPECIRMVQEQKYDAIFLDHMMPDMDGIETLHYLKELDTNKSATAPIIALTANAISGARELYLSEGFDDFLTKPIVPEKLEAMLVKHLPQEKVIKTVRNSQSKQEEEILELENSQKSKNELAKKDLVDIQLEKVMERLGSIPEMKLDYVQVLYGDGNDFLAQMQYFLDKEAIWMDELEKNYQLLLECSDGGTEEVQQRYLDVIRSMRISTNAIGACMLSGLSDILEKAIQWGRMETVKNVTPILMEEWRRITGRIREEYRVTS